MKENSKKSPIHIPSRMENLAISFTRWIGSPASLLTHTILFCVGISLLFSGLDFNKVLLVFNTAVSLEAIYLAIFIQMTVNRNTQSLEEVEEDIDEIQEDVDEIQKDVDDIQEDVDEIEKDVDEIQKDVDEIEKDDQDELMHDKKTQDVLFKIQGELQKLMKEIESVKQEKK